MTRSGLHYRRPAPPLSSAEFRAQLAELLARLEAGDVGRAVAAVINYGLRATYRGSAE